MNPINIGIIGLGRIGKLHADNIIKFNRAMRVHAVADVYLDQEWLAARNITRAYSDPDPILADQAIDAVIICSPTPTHAAYIMAAAKAGKHIFCEKPIAFETDTIYQVITAVNKAKVKLQIGFNRRFDPSFAKVQQAVAAGRVGRVHLIRITSYDPAPPPAEYIKQSGGMFLDMSIHDFDMARFLAGSEITEVYANGSVLIDQTFAEFNDIDTAVIQLKFASGALGVIDNSRQAVYGYDQRIEVFGSGGSMSASNHTETNTVLSTENGVIKDKPLHFFLERYQQAYIAELSAFADCILQDLPSPVDGNDGLMSVSIARAAQQSLDQRQPIQIKEN